MATPRCVLVPTSTVFAPVTSISTVVSTTSTTYVVVNNGIVSTSVDTILAGRSSVVTTILVTGLTETTTALVPVTSTSTFVTSTPISTLYAPCPTTSTTSTTSSATPTSTLVPITTSTTPTTSSTPRTTVTSLTTVSRSSSSTSSSSSSLASPVSFASTTPVGAIAGGTVGGVAALVILIWAIWFFCARKSRHDNKDFDFAGDDAWDPAAGVVAGGAMGAGGLRRRSFRNGSGSLSRPNNDGMGHPMDDMAGYGEGEYAVGRGGGGNDMEEQQQYQYYGNPPQSSTGHGGVGVGGIMAAGGMAGVGAMGRSGTSHSGHDHQQQPLDEIPGDPYGGLDAGPVDGGYAVAATRGGSNQYGSQSSHGGGYGPSYNQRVPPPPVQPFYAGAPRSLTPLPLTSASASGASRQASSPPLGGSASYNSGSSIPYHPPSPSLLTAQNGGLGSQFEQQQQQQNRSGSSYLSPGAVPHSPASPAPSHRSIPALGAVWTPPTPGFSGTRGEEEHEGEGEDEEEYGQQTRSGPLRVVNDHEREEGYPRGVGSGSGSGSGRGQGQEEEEEARFGRSESAYDSLTAGLTDRS